MQGGGLGETYGRAAMDFEFVPASPDSRWAGETAARRRQRRLSSPSLRTYLTPAFDAAAGGDGGVTGHSSSSSSGGLDLGFDASLLRYRRACFAATADLDSRVLLYSPQSAPPPPPLPQARMAYPVAEDGIWAPGGYHYGSKQEAGGRLTATPVFQDFEGMSFISPRQTIADHPAAARGATNSIKLPSDLQESVVPGMKVDFSTPKAEAKALTEQPDPTEDIDSPMITNALYGPSGRRRLPIFRDICPE
ncbi:hypothetical protein EJB05_11087 [Eragrostis curvula]|uniref:Uncharacterized protein n=1 Tax=Eragrostis curvula TaxID=38414 RepID=A0A5J9VNL5_9POAL|nr:hypothetical protein EJB05_11087 [Eragrostis curvula]